MFVCRCPAVWESYETGVPSTQRHARADGAQRVQSYWLIAAVLVAASLSRPARAVETARPRVVETFPHDAHAFTQGLLLYRGNFYESTGLEGRSTLRRVDPSTGTVTQSVALLEHEFGEGLARVDQRLIQLTWQNQLKKKNRTMDASMEPSKQTVPYRS